MCIRDSKWCESGKTTDRRTREHFADCCGVQGFRRDQWFNCTGCTKWGSFGEYVPDSHRLIFFVREGELELLCNECFDEIGPMWRKMQKPKSYVCAEDHPAVSHVNEMS